MLISGGGSKRQARTRGDPLAPRPVGTADLQQAAARLQEAASRLRPTASRLLAWVVFQTLMCGRSSVKAAPPVVAAALGVSERTIWTLITELEGQWLLVTRGNGSAKVWQLADQCKTGREPVQSTSAETGAISASRRKKTLQNCTGSSHARVFGSDFLLEEKSSSPDQTTLIVENKDDDDDVPTFKPMGPETTAAVQAERADHQLIVEEVRFGQDQLRRSMNLGHRKPPIGPPGFQRAAAIRRLFQNRKDFLSWLDEFDGEGKVESIRAEGIGGYAFYLADAKRHLQHKRSASGVDQSLAERWRKSKGAAE